MPRRIKPYEPGSLHHTNVGSERLYWPAHPLALTQGFVSVAKLLAWQNENYSPLALQYMLDKPGTSGWGVRFPWNPYGPTMHSSGYVLWFWPDHPLSEKHSGYVREHRAVIWQESGYSNAILYSLLVGHSVVHHRNGNKEDNRPENLELRLIKTHVRGIGEQDMVFILQTLGYRVEKRKS